MPPCPHLPPDDARMETPILSDAEMHNLEDAAGQLREGREEILKDWVERVRDNRAVKRGQTLSDPLLLDHVPQLFDAMLDRLETLRPREEADQLAAVHGFSRKVGGYSVVEAVAELLMFRRAIWSHVTATHLRLEAAYAVMEQIDGMVDRAVISSLQALTDPGARMLGRKDAAGGGTNRDSAG